MLGGSSIARQALQKLDDYRGVVKPRFVGMHSDHPRNSVGIIAAQSTLEQTQREIILKPECRPVSTSNDGRHISTDDLIQLHILVEVLKTVRAQYQKVIR